MENILSKKVSFEELFKLSDEVLSKFANLGTKECLKYIRSSLRKDVLSTYHCIGRLSFEQTNLLGAKTSEVKLSLDSLLKNRINHPELSFKDYEKINEIIKKPDVLRLSKNKRNSILLLKKDAKMYQVVIKTTLSKEENFLTSFRFAEH